jgi:hypothetical protein
MVGEEVEDDAADVDLVLERGTVLEILRPDDCADLEDRQRVRSHPVERADEIRM